MIRAYFDSLKREARSFSLLTDFKLIKEFVDPTKGFIRFKMQLKGESEVHVFEYVTWKLEKLDYSYHFQDKNKKMIVRWDNAPHHPELVNYPHHLHNGQNVKGTSKKSFKNILKEIERILLLVNLTIIGKYNRSIKKLLNLILISNLIIL